MKYKNYYTVRILQYKNTLLYYKINYGWWINAISRYRCPRYISYR